MRDFPFPRKEGVNLYRVYYKIRANGEVRGPIGFHDFEVAQKIVANFNARYGEDCEYFWAQVNIKGLSENELISLVNQEKLSLKEALPYLPLNSPHVEMWRLRDASLNYL